jgi:HlyD family secretion protein
LSAVTTRSNTTAKTTDGENADKNEEPAPAAPSGPVEEVVFVQDEASKVKSVKVKTGISDFENIEILSGLEEGQKVVSGPFRAVSKTLKDGSKVAVKDEKSLNKSALADANGEK